MNTSDAAGVVPFFDAHVHFWDHSVPDFVWGWLDPSFTQLGDTYRLDAPRFTTPEFRDEVKGAGVAGIVHINATLPLADPSAETGWLEEMAEAYGWPNALVGACDLRSPEAPEILQRHSRRSRVRGVRDLGFAEHLDLDAVGPALAAAADLDLCIELRTPVPQLDVLRELAKRWPAVHFVLGHAGLPPVRNPETFSAWRAALVAMAEAPNFTCKVSAVGSSADRNWTVESIRPWIKECVAVFGADRCMFGTNWPLDRLWRPYQELVGAYRQIAAELPEADQHSLFHGTAERTYRTTVT